MSPTEELIMEHMKSSLKFGEGLMIKSLGAGSIYEPDRRSDLWLKAKKDYLGGLALHDTLDLVPLGGWHGLGKELFSKQINDCLLLFFFERASALEVGRLSGIRPSCWRCMTLTRRPTRPSASVCQDSPTSSTRP